MKNYNILITNDDGIESPGLRAAVEAAMDLGTVTVAAPSFQQTGAGRGLTGDKQARLIPGLVPEMSACFVDSIVYKA